jgi:ATP phosphoribosyltransferase
MRKAGFHCTIKNRSYFPWIDDEELQVMLIRAQEIARYVEDLVYAKQTRQPFRWVVAVPESSDIKTIQDLEGKRIATEVVHITEMYLKEHGINARVEFSWGATEAKAPDLVDAIVDGTETGGSLRANKLRILDTILFEVDLSVHAIFQGLIEQGVLIRDVGRYPMLDKAMRVTIGAREENEAFLEALREVVRIVE